MDRDAYTGLSEKHLLVSLVTCTAVFVSFTRCYNVMSTQPAGEDQDVQRRRTLNLDKFLSCHSWAGVDCNTHFTDDGRGTVRQNLHLLRGRLRHLPAAATPSRSSEIVFRRDAARLGPTTHDGLAFLTAKARPTDPTHRGPSLAEFSSETRGAKRTENCKGSVDGTCCTYGSG